MKADWIDHPCFEEEGRGGGRNPIQKIRFLVTILWVCCQFVPVAEGQAIGTLITVGERRTTEFSVDNMNGLFNTLSNYDCSGCNTGNSIMPNGATAVLAVGVYKCSGGTCSAYHTMLWTEGLHGEVKCEEDDASCVLNGEQTRRGMNVLGTGAGTLLLRALTFQDGEASAGGGVWIESGAIVTIELCVFSNCRATDSRNGGGAIVVWYNGGTVNIYGTSFNDNTAASGNGDDIYRSSGTITIHKTCPSPYSSNTPIQGQLK